MTSILNPNNHDPYYRSIEFRIKYRSPIMWILFDTHKKYNGQIYNLPNNISTDPILRWFRQNYEECEISADPNTYLQMQEVFELLKKDDLYKNLSESDKRKITKESLIHKFKEHDWFKAGYEERFRYNDITVKM